MSSSHIFYQFWLFRGQLYFNLMPFIISSSMWMNRATAFFFSFFLILLCTFVVDKIHTRVSGPKPRFITSTNSLCQLKKCVNSLRESFILRMLDLRLSPSNLQIWCIIFCDKSSWIWLLSEIVDAQTCKNNSFSMKLSRWRSQCSQGTDDIFISKYIQNHEKLNKGFL